MESMPNPLEDGGTRHQDQPIVQVVQAGESQAQQAPGTQTLSEAVTICAGMTKMQLDAAVPSVTAPTPPKRTKVAILGFVQHYKQAPFNDPSFEIWGLNELYQFIPRWDRWFEIHSRSLYENDRNRTSEHVNKLKAMTCPLYMHKHWDDIPASVPYPMDAICQMFPNPCPEARPYLTNSITYMILLAIAEGFQELHLYGVDMSHSSEYAQQRPSCEWAVGIAQGRGIKVYVPSESDLLKCLFLYGYEEEAARAFDRKMAAREAEMSQNITNLDNEIARLTEIRAQYRGAHQDTQHIRSNWKSLHTTS